VKRAFAGPQLVATCVEHGRGSARGGTTSAGHQGEVRGSSAGVGGKGKLRGSGAGVGAKGKVMGGSAGLERKTTRGEPFHHGIAGRLVERADAGAIDVEQESLDQHALRRLAPIAGQGGAQRSGPDRGAGQSDGRGDEEGVGVERCDEGGVGVVWRVTGVGEA
jgi:hypothetical protein